MNLAAPIAIKHDADSGAADARCTDREMLIVGFDTDAAAVHALLPVSLAPDGSNTALAEFAAVPEPGGGSRTEFNLLIPALHGAEPVLYSAYSTPDDDTRPPRASTRLVIVHDTLTGILQIHGRPMAIAAMNYRRADVLERRRAFGAIAPAETLRRLRPSRVAAADEREAPPLVVRSWSDIHVHCAWSGPATLDLLWPAASALAALPVNRVHGGLHCVVDFRHEAARLLAAVAGRAQNAAAVVAMEDDFPTAGAARYFARAGRTAMRMIGRVGARRATSLNPAAAKVATPIHTEFAPGNLPRRTFG